MRNLKNRRRYKRNKDRETKKKRGVNKGRKGKVGI